MGLEEDLVPAEDIGTGGGAVGSAVEGVDVGVGVAEAAGVGGGTHIDGLGHLLVQLDVQLAQDIPDNLGTGGGFGIHQALGGEFPVAAVVVDA